MRLVQRLLDHWQNDPAPAGPYAPHWLRGGHVSWMHAGLNARWHSHDCGRGWNGHHWNCDRDHHWNARCWSFDCDHCRSARYCSCDRLGRLESPDPLCEPCSLANASGRHDWIWFWRTALPGLLYSIAWSDRPSVPSALFCQSSCCLAVPMCRVVTQP